MTSSSKPNENLTIQIPKAVVETDLDVIENGGISPQLSIRTEDDACSEIIRIDPQTPDERPTALGRFVQTLQVSRLCCIALTTSNSTYFDLQTLYGLSSASLSG